MYGSVSCLQFHAYNFCIRMGWMNSQRYQWFWCERRAGGFYISSLDALDIWVGVNLSRIGKVVVSYMSLTAWRCFHVWRCFLVQLGREVLEIFSLFSVNIKMLCYAMLESSPDGSLMSWVSWVWDLPEPCCGINYSCMFTDFTACVIALIMFPTIVHKYKYRSCKQNLQCAPQKYIKVYK